jgi:transposase
MLPWQSAVKCKTSAAGRALHHSDSESVGYGWSRAAWPSRRTTFVAAPDELRDATRELTRMQLIRTCAAWRPDLNAAADPVVATRIALKSLARRIIELGDEVANLDEPIEWLVRELNPTLLNAFGIGVEIAGQLVVTAGDNPERLRSEAGFAMLWGVAPLPASSGQTQRHRLNRGGDRQANRALHLAAITRLCLCPRTRAYADRRKAEALSKREIIRCLKRYIAREVYRQLTTPARLDKHESDRGCQGEFKGPSQRCRLMRRMLGPRRRCSLG